MPTNGQGYGRDFWGVGPWGVAAPTGTFSVEDVFANSERTVRVTFTDPALAVGVLGDGDALNPASWAVTVGGTPLTLYTVRDVAGDGRQFELYSYEKFPGYPAQLVVDASAVLSASGGGLVGPGTATIDGAAQARPQPKEGPADLRNAQTAPGELSGVLVTGSGGGYETERGIPLLRKLIIRRLTTLPGEFFHLPGYGTELDAKLAVRDPGTLRARVERQVMMEPDVQSVRAAVTIQADGIVRVHLTVVRRADGEAFSFGTDLRVAQ